VVTDADLEAAEVAARMALHRVNADMGEQLLIRRNEREIEVSGILDSARRKSEIEAALEQLPHVRVVLLSPDDLARSSDTDARIMAALQSPPLPVAEESPAILEPWMKQEYPNLNDRLAFVNRITELARECLGHAHALKELADRYQTWNEPGIRPIARDHIVALEKSWGQLSALTSPAIGIATDRPAGAGVSGGAANATRLLESLNELNRCLLRLFTQHSSFESDSSENQLQIWRRLRQDADAALAALAGN
jgi:hypothetical protein